MKLISTIFVMVSLFVTMQSCKKHKEEIPHAQTQTTTVIINNVVTVNGVTTVTSDTINITNPAGGGTNTGGGGNAAPVYVQGIVTPNSSMGSLAVGETYWGFTSVPSACAASGSYDVQCNPIAIKITGIGANGRYTYTAYPTLTFASQNGFYPYIAADAYGGDLVKTQISGALLMDNYPFVIVTF